MILSTIMYLNSFFAHSYLNIIHIIYCILLIRSKYCIEYNFWVKSKKTLMIILIVLDILYLIVKTIFFLIYIFARETVNKIYPFFIIEYDWKNYYDYAIVSLIVILILVYLIIGEFEEDFWRASILPKTNNILKMKSPSSNNILNIGLFYITLGASMYPSVINLVILFIGVLFFVGMILNKKFRTLMKKYTCIIYLFLIPIYIIINYAVNSNEIMSRITNKYTKLCFVDLFKDEDSDGEAAENLIDNIIYIGSIPFLLFFLGFNEINTHLKCLEYIEKERKRKESKKIRETKSKFSFISSFDNNDDSTTGNNKNERILSLLDSLNINRKKKK